VCQQQTEIKKSKIGVDEYESVFFIFLKKCFVFITWGRLAMNQVCQTKLLHLDHSQPTLLDDYNYVFIYLFRMNSIKNNNTFIKTFYVLIAITLTIECDFSRSHRIGEEY